jgi:hypothetical protein
MLSAFILLVHSCKIIITEYCKEERLMVKVLFIGVVILTLSVFPAFAAEDKTAPPDAGIQKVVEETLGQGVHVIRTDKPEKAPIEGWKQTRVWIETAYGETPVLFYSTGDGKFIFAGSIFSDSGENLTRKEVGETKPRHIEDAKMELNEDYMIGDKNAVVKAVLWLGADKYSGQLFKTFYDLYNNNKDKVVLYIKFFPMSAPDLNKVKALTCFKGEALAKALQVVYDANPMWGSPEDLEAFRKTGDLKACNDELVLKDMKLTETLKLPAQPQVFVNGTLLINEATKENVSKLAGIELR